VVKFRCERDSLAEAIGNAQRAVASRAGALPVLSGLLVRAEPGQLELVGSDLELTIRVSTPAECDEQGTGLVPARLFGDIVRSLEPGAVTVEVHDDEARITSGRSQFSVRLLAVDEFPRLAEPAEGGVRMNGAALSEALRQVVPAASRDDARPILTGVLLTAEGSGLRLVATDSYRLAVRDLPGESVLAVGQKVLVPAKALGELQRLLTDADAEVSFSERDVSFNVGKARVSTRLIEGEFPNYQQLIPSGYPNRLTVARDALIEAAKRVRLVAQGRERDTSPVRLAMRADGLELTARGDAGDAQEVVDAKYEGAEMTVAFNPEFLLDAAHAINSPDVVIETQDALKPATLRGRDGTEFLYLLMPVRVS
jgi:DNA polymerase-3 subunit beta